MAGHRDAAAWVVVVGLALLLAGALAGPVMAATTPDCDADPDGPACEQDDHPSRAAAQGLIVDATDRTLADRTPTAEARERWDPPWLAWMSAIAVVLVALAAAWWLFLERRIQDRFRD